MFWFRRKVGVFHYCAMYQDRPGQMSYIYGILETNAMVNRLEFPATILKYIAEQTKGQASPEDLVLLSLSRLS